MTLERIKLERYQGRTARRERRARPKTVVVAGGAGFLGAHLCGRLIGQGARVLCLDNLQTGRMSNLGALVHHPDFAFILHDVTEPFDYDGPVDEIYNLACPASPPKYQADPIRTFKTSVFGALHLLELARARGARILQASTSEIYGDPEVSPQPEGYRGQVNTTGPRACYDEGKRAAETLFYDYGESYGLAVKIARIFNTYGPKMCADDGRVVSNFITQALRGESLTIYGDGRQTRSFCYVSDLIDGLIRLMASPKDFRSPVNLGNPGEFTMLELAQLVQRMTGSQVEITHRPLPKDDPRQRRPDISRARAVLGWRPYIPLEVGLAPTIAHFAAELGLECPVDVAAALAEQGQRVRQHFAIGSTTAEAVPAGQVL